MTMFMTYGLLWLNKPEKKAAALSADPTVFDKEACGFRIDGWDWRLWPGTTTMLVPPYTVYGNYGEGGSVDPFKLGTDLEQDGMFAYVGRSPEMSFRKSFFFFGNRCTVLTSDIKAGTAKDGRDPKTSPMVTTLYQVPLPKQPAMEPCVVDGEAVTAFPSEKVLESDKTHWLMDNRGQGYYIHAGGGSVRVARKIQTWTRMMRDSLRKSNVNSPRFKGVTETALEFMSKPTAKDETMFIPKSSDFATAYFDHGVGPKVTSCAYSFFVAPKPEEISRFVSEMERKDPPYRILEQDTQAHILWDRDTKTTGYSIFDSQWAHESDILRAASHPCVVMLREGGNNQIKASVCIKEIRELPVYKTLRDFPTPATPKPLPSLELTLRGEWKVAHSDSAHFPCEVTPGKATGTTLLRIRYDLHAPSTMSWLPLRLVLENKRGK